MRRALVLALIVAAAGQWGAGPGKAHAQDCMTASRAEALVIAKQRHGKECAIRCEGCGCKGGPGYRDRRGRCVGWSKLVDACGPPPHALCRRECQPVVGECDDPRNTPNAEDGQ